MTERGADTATATAGPDAAAGGAGLIAGQGVAAITGDAGVTGSGTATTPGDAAAAPPSGRPPSLWRNRDFNLLWSGQSLSDLGTAMSDLALPLLVLQLTGSPTRAGLVGTAGLAIATACRLPAGVLADRFDRRRLLIVCDVIRLVGYAALAWAVMTKEATLPVILAVVPSGAAATAVFSTTEFAAVRSLVHPEHIVSAVARNEARSYGAALAGPPLGGLLFGLGRALPFVGNALSYLFSLIAVLLIRRPLQQGRPEAPPDQNAGDAGVAGVGAAGPAADGGGDADGGDADGAGAGFGADIGDIDAAGGGDATGGGEGVGSDGVGGDFGVGSDSGAGVGSASIGSEGVGSDGVGGDGVGAGVGGRSSWQGLSFVLANPFLRSLIAIATPLNMAFTGMIFALTLSLRRAGQPPGLIGLATAIIGAGGLLGAFLAPALQRRLRLPTLIRLVCWSAAGLMGISVLLSPSVVSAVPLALAVFLGPSANAALFGYQVALTPDHLQGRVVSVVLLAATSAAALAPTLAGVLLAHVAGHAALLVFPLLIGIAAVVATSSSGIRSAAGRP